MRSRRPSGTTWMVVTVSDDSEGVTPRERCPYCGELVEHASKDPLEESCTRFGCDYYRAEIAPGKVINDG